MNFIFQLIIGLVLSLASTLIKSIFQQDQKQKVPGVRGSIQTGGDSPLSFIMGFYATGGHLKYAGTWGNAGETPNAYYSKVVSVSDLPVRGLSGFYVNGERVTLAGMPTGDLGYPALEYRVGGVDHLWVKFYNGTQTVADPLMRAQFGADPNRPYTADMVGRGVAYFVATALVNRELFSGFPEYLAEVHGIPLSDPRGDGQHDNPMVGVYTLAKGLYYGGQWVYGPQNITDANFIAANLEAQMDKCDTLRDGTTEKRFRFGMEISVDAEPHAIIGEMLKACEGRVAEIGGIYKFLVGEPDAPVVSFTDEDLVISEGQTYEPFPGLESLFNGMGATYPEPGEGWELKEAPPRYRSDLEVLDDNRRLPFTTQYKAVPFALQVQELMRAAIEEVRRFRRHTQTMPPEWWEYEPLDAVAWTSARNGYSGKVFLITAMDDLPNVNQFVGLQETDPSDYDWSSDYELPFDVVPLVIARPAPQEVSGFFVEPAIAYDSEGRPRRPAIDVFWSAASVTVDVRAVRITVALPDESDEDEPGTLVWDGEAPRPELGSARLVEALLPNQAYLVQIQYVPHSGRATVESGWLAVTTPDVRYTSLDIEIDEIRDEVLESVGELDRETRINARDLIEDKRSQILLAVQGQLADYSDRQLIRRALVAQDGANRAEYKEDILVATGPGSAIVTRIEELRAEVFDPDTGLPATAEAISLLSAEVHNPDTGLEALANMVDLLSVSYGDVSADGLLSVEVGIAPSGVSSRAILSTRATAGGAVASAAMMLDSRIISGTLTSEVLLVGGRISLVASTSPSATKRGMLVVDGDNVYIDNARIRSLTAVNIATNSLDATVINVASIFAQNAAIAGQLTVGASILIDGPNGRILVSD